MIKRLVIDADQGMRLPVLIISRERTDMIAAVEALARRPWRGRILYFEAAFRGGVDLMIEAHGEECSVFESRSGGWGIESRYSRPATAEVVKTLFARYPLRGTDDVGADLSLAVPRFQATEPVALRPKTKPGQLALF